ncbi:hypothetical protein JOQ06_001003 [Pogonophryne albipinna]|uniref:Uncharacterized protein n=1 Tax=Pogonophryne albipinna TaxID=1090488 RepID=A0AAD6B506_9TELE|nr:hypothetical protein JOQ06_001003 [Pogonophryne albipinna]
MFHKLNLLYLSNDQTNNNINRIECPSSAGQPDRKESLCPPEEACSLQTVSLLQGRPAPDTSTAPLHLEDPIRIHNRISRGSTSSSTMKLLDNMLRFPGVDEDGLVHVDVSYGAGVQPPLYNVDVSGEPEPEYPPAKREKH